MTTSIINTPITQNKESQSKITPKRALDLLMRGNQRFLNNDPIDRDLLQQVEATEGGQFPFAVVLSCIDSRIPTEIIFDQGIGDIFNARIAGNVVNKDILGSMEFACKLAGSKLILVLGHTSCGAVKGACDGAQLGNLTQMLNKIQPAVDAVPTAEGEERSSANTEFVNRVSEKNVRLNMEQITMMSPVLKEMVNSGKIEIHGAMYEVETGQVRLLDKEIS